MTQNLTNIRESRIRQRLQRIKTKMYAETDYTIFIRTLSRTGYEMSEAFHSVIPLPEVRANFNTFINELIGIHNLLFPDQLLVRNQLVYGSGPQYGNFYGVEEAFATIVGSLHLQVQASLVNVVNPPHEMNRTHLERLEQLLQHFMLNNGLIPMDIEVPENGQ